MNDLTKPIKIRLSIGMIVTCVLFTLFACVIGYGIVVINTKTVLMEDDTPVPAFLKVIFTVIAAVIEMGILVMIISLWKRIFKDGAMTLTQAGIENTFLIFTVLAFWTTLRIRLIPWTALKIDESDENRYVVDTNQLPPGSVGVVAKFMLKITGFNFRIGRIKKEELDHYCHMMLAQSKANNTITDKL